MNRLAPWLGLLLLCVGCADDRRGAPPFDQEIEIPRTETFAASLSAYALYQQPMADLQPAAGVLPYELSSELFTDYAHKQRLMVVPDGTEITLGEDARPVFPDGTTLVKTFYYPADMRAPDDDWRIIETRLLIKVAGRWNMATYVWNAAQTDATLLLDGATTDVAWIDEGGQARSTTYAVPHEGECVTCHQASGATAYIGPTARNLNRSVTRGDEVVDQLAFLDAAGVLADDLWASSPSVPDYTDDALPLAKRARAYLDINCAHCHRPGGWGEASRRRVDLRYSTPVDETGLSRKKRDMVRVLEAGEMPYLGTTLVDEAGVGLVLTYLNSL